jgi:hypothetical protein
MRLQRQQRQERLTPVPLSAHRYAAQAQRSSRADWGRAGRYYRAAAALCPGNGHPCNQLAVMAYYTGEELRAVYFYFRWVGAALATPRQAGGALSAPSLQLLVPEPALLAFLPAR